ncbi:Nif3-like dinuclear metal center hexameric protein [Thalassotalea ponticola]|uniref:Nif3-like dinuclear metal center hexameric protein n=1 Tax=Thalassotalea ponticola TaxID=1523392 RepID=UPI0025B5CF02|nr:Nif3-like dinuclear metal center hexameric protein [Thalassotalea ponticola]MDN3651412.1 Nif3-like dinuclear metal center hexameric protein [Thalassotalea ponticola]
MQRNEFLTLLNGILQPERIKDYCPNGLQVQGSEAVKRIVTGVTASQALIDAAIEHKADTILVHHGYFWKNESYPITGIKYNRIKALIDNEINLFAYHLPLDIHATLGNNAQLAKRLDIVNVSPLEQGNDLSVSMRGEFTSVLTSDALAQRIDTSLNRPCLHIAAPSNKPIKTVAWCTGGGQGFIEQAGALGIDAFISGEISEQTTHLAREMDIHYFAAGHHATERYGVKALGEYLQQQHGFDVVFIDIDNPA